MVEYRVQQLDHVFGALADPTRRTILEHLGNGPARVTDIATRFPLSLNAVSKHLVVLERAGLIRREVQGRNHICRLEGKPLQGASAWMVNVQTFWEERLNALEQHVAAKRKGRK